jgi:hypothetical protein
MGLTRIRAEQISNIDYKQAVRVVSTTNVTLSGGAPVVVDGVTLTQGNRVLVTGQSTASQNGIYVVQTLGTGEDGTWIRATDANQTGEIEPGMVVMVTEGTTYADTPWKLITNGAIVIGTTALTFQQFSSGANVGGTDTNVQYNSSGNLAGSSNFTWSGTELYVNGAANITGNVTGNYFFGNGSQLSGIITSVANINNGTSNVSIDAVDANITMSVNGTANVVVVSTDLVNVNGNVQADYFLGNGSQLTGIQAGAVTTVANTAPVSPSQGDIWINSDTGSQYIYFTSDGNSQWAEMEADQSFSTAGSEVNLTAVNTDILPTANITYDIGNTTNRFRDIYLANSTIYLGEAQISATDGAIVLPANSTVGGAVVTAVPKITGFDYPGDDTAADPAGGQTILINGANFESGCVVYLDNAVISPVVFVSSSQLSFTAPAKATGTYSLYVINPDGSTALALPGMMYSGVPTWSTAAGSIGTPYETTSFATTLVATADSAVTYATAPGNTLPANLSLNSSTGNLTGTIPVTNNDTTYTFSVRATDAELQDTDRQFSVTYRTDVVTWNSPANASSYTWGVGIANTVPLNATSAAGKSISYTVESGSLPANVSISGNLITGSPGNIQSNTAVVIRATAASTNRTSDRTLYFTVEPAAPTSVEYLVVAGGGPGGGGGSTSGGYNGGGGAGGLLFGNTAISTGVAYTITVGAGGGGFGGVNPGSNSVFSTITALGGGWGSMSNYQAGSGGSGGGGWSSRPPGSGTAGPPRQGYNGGQASSNYSGGGGGGAGMVGGGGANGSASQGFYVPRTEYVGPRGGDGLADASLGSMLSATSTGENVNSTWYVAGGGAGGTGGAGHFGGYGGGGTGGHGYGNGSTTAGMPNTGGGGGGGSYGAPGFGNNGGSGVVVIRYPDSFPAAAATTGSPTVTTAGGYRYYKFTGSGTITW